MQDFLADFSMLLLGVISALLILVVLLQRGRGGGLAGAFGGLGGQSAFGTKAGDVFTKITIGLVTAWVLLAGVSGVLARKASEKGDFADAVVEDVIEDEDSEATGAGMSSMSSGEGTTGGDLATDDAPSSDDKGTEAASTEESETAAPSESEPEAKPVDANDDKEATPSEAETAPPDDKE